MLIRWYGQSAFLLTGEHHRVFVDPFGDLAGAAGRSDWKWDYPPVEGVEADVLLVTHDHLDHNAVEAIDGDPVVLATAGTHESPLGEVVGIASEHDAVAGTERGPNTIFRFELDGTTVAHFGDFGQPSLRPAQREALGEVDVLFLPSAAGRRSRRTRPRSSWAISGRGSSCRCTTGRRRSASSIRPTRSSMRWERGSSGSSRARRRWSRCSAAARSRSWRCWRRPCSG